MPPEIERVHEGEQNHPIDGDIVCQIAYDHGVMPRVLDSLLRRCSQAWDEDRRLLEWAVQQLAITAYEVEVENVSDELMVIDGRFFTVIHLMQKFGIRGPEIGFNVSTVHLAIMAQEAHAEQAARIRSDGPFVDEEFAYPVVMFRKGHDFSDPDE